MSSSSKTIEVNKLKQENKHLKSRLQRSLKKQKNINGNRGKDHRILSATLNGFGRVQKNQERLQNKVTKMEIVNSNLMQMMHWGKENQGKLYSSDVERGKDLLNMSEFYPFIID